MKLLSKSFSWLLTFLLLLVSGIYGFLFFSFLNTPLIAIGKPATNLLFLQGYSAKKVAYILKKQDLIQHPLFFIILIKITGNEHSLKAGEYLIEPGTTPINLIHKMAKGEAVRHAFTIIEGWTFSQLLTALKDNQFITHTVNSLSSDKIMEKIGRPGELPEGRFAPDTYLFSGNKSDLELLSWSYQLMQKQLQLAWDNRAQDLPYNCPYEALIVASIIEKETAKAAEKPLIAGIILRRLKIGMPLQACPTVIYSLGKKYSGKLKKHDFLIASKYNTYLHRGLPPAPISLPSKESIIAALHPTPTRFLYYAAKGNGSHEFSESFSGQKQVVKKYLRKKQ